MYIFIRRIYQQIRIAFGVSGKRFVFYVVGHFSDVPFARQIVISTRANDICVKVNRCRIQSFQRVQKDKIIGVNEANVFAACEVQPHVSRDVAAAARIFFCLQEIEHSFKFRHITFDDIDAVVGGAVVNHDDFKICERLSQKTFKAFADIFCRVVHRDNHRNGKNILRLIVINFVLQLGKSFLVASYVFKFRIYIGAKKRHKHIMLAQIIAEFLLENLCDLKRLQIFAFFHYTSKI